jgi:hypothetical protein
MVEKTNIFTQTNTNFCVKRNKFNHTEKIYSHAVVWEIYFAPPISSAGRNKWYNNPPPHVLTVQMHMYLLLISPGMPIRQPQTTHMCNYLICWVRANRPRPIDLCSRAELVNARLRAEHRIFRANPRQTQLKHGCRTRPEANPWWAGPCSCSVVGAWKT